MLSFTPDNGHTHFSIDFDRFDCHNLRTGTGRWSYKCTINVEGEDIDAGEIHSAATDTQDNPTRLGEMLASFLNFFSSYVEAVNAESMGRTVDSGALTTFPDECKELAEALDGDQVFSWADQVFPKMGDA